MGNSKSEQLSCSQAAKYAFKCHRDSSSGDEIRVHPVNAVAFHSGYGSFTTGGSDGGVSVWDGANRRRICQLHSYPTSNVSLAFSPPAAGCPADQFLAIASSYMHQHAEGGDRPHPADAVFIRRLADTDHHSDVRPRGVARH